MNWTGGRRTRIQASEEKVKQRQFFERQRRNTLDQRTSLSFFQENRRCWYPSTIYPNNPQPKSPNKQSGRSSSEFYEELDLKAEHHDPSRYNSARLDCLDMLKSSSFDWVGEAFQLRSLPDHDSTIHRPSAETTKRSNGMGDKYENEGTASFKRNRVQSRGGEGQSYEPPTYSDNGAFRSNSISLNQDDTQYTHDFNDCEVRAQEEDEAEEIEEEVEEEEEPLLIPERHIAICKEYRSRQCKVEAFSKVSGDADNLKQHQYPFRPEVDRHLAQKGGPAVVASPLRTRCLSVEAPGVLSPHHDKSKATPYTPSSASKEGGITTAGGDRPQEQEQEPFREMTTSPTVPSPSPPLNTTVQVETEVGAASVGLRMEVSLSPSFADSTGTHDADLAERNEILRVKDLGPSANATDGPAMSFMSSVISVSPDWPPPNQLAGHQLQIEGIAKMQHSYFLYGISGNEKYDAQAMGVGSAIDQCSSQSATFFTDVDVETDIDCSLTKKPLPSPVLLPSDPEDTSVLEPICSLDGMGLLFESSAKAQAQSDLNPSPSEWIGSDDWVEE